MHRECSKRTITREHTYSQVLFFALCSAENDRVLERTRIATCPLNERYSCSPVPFPLFPSGFGGPARLVLGVSKLNCFILYSSAL